MYENLAVIAVFAYVFSTIAGRLERSFISGPILFLAFGLLAGPVGLGIINLSVDTQELRVMADITLALVLFIDAANADLTTLRSHSLIPRRMLMIGLPLCIALGVAVGWLIFPGVSVLELCILATMLAATDAALGKAVVSNKEVPAGIRESLNAESGLNDGICVPILFVFLALATQTSSGEGGTALALKLVAQEIGIGAVVGLGFAFAGAKLAIYCWRHGWFTDVWLQIPVITLAIACFATAQSLHGSGYIAAFIGGMLYGHLTKSSHQLVLAAEGTGELFAMATWIAFGAVVLGQSWESMSWQIVAYSLLSLTLIRMLPVVLALTATGVNFESKLFLAWFGPRGLASVVFAIIVANEHLPNADILINTVVCTVTLCVFAHGITANPWATAFAGRMKKRVANRDLTDP
jgi:NhaP-type Na+/H+ or K+/H+ antiporter